MRSTISLWHGMQLLKYRSYLNHLTVTLAIMQTLVYKWKADNICTTFSHCFVSSLDIAIDYQYNQYKYILYLIGQGHEPGRLHSTRPLCVYWIKFPFCLLSRGQCRKLFTHQARSQWLKLLEIDRLQWPSLHILLIKKWPWTCTHL